VEKEKVTAVAVKGEVISTEKAFALPKVAAPARAFAHPY